MVIPTQPTNEFFKINYWIHLVHLSAVCPPVRYVCRRYGFWSVNHVCFGISVSNFMCMPFVAMDINLLISATPLSKWPPHGYIEYFSFQTLTIVWLRQSTPNFSSTFLVCIDRSLLVFSDVIFKVAIWRPYCFCFQTLTIFSFEYICMGRSISVFSNGTLKMAAWQLYWIFWFPDEAAWFPGCSSGLYWNFSFKFYVHIVCSYGQKSSVTILKMATRQPSWIFGFQTLNFAF